MVKPKSWAAQRRCTWGCKFTPKNRADLNRHNELFHKLKLDNSNCHIVPSGHVMGEGLEGSSQPTTG